MATITLTGLVHRDATSVLDPRKSMPDYRLEIYNMLQYLDEQQDQIEHCLATYSQTGKERESEIEDDFVVVEDLNRPLRRKMLVSQLQQVWRTREMLRQRAKHLNIRIDSLQHGRHVSLMSFDDDFAFQEDPQSEEI